MVHRLLKPAASSVRSPAGIALIAGVLVAHAATVVGALRGWADLYYVAALASLCADILAQQTLAVRTLLGRAQLGYLNRAMIRELSLIILVARLDDLAPDAFFVFALAVVALPATRFALLLLRAPLARRRLRPVEVRNLDLPLAEPADAPAWTRLRLQTLVLMSAATIALSALGVGRNTWGPFFVAVAAVLLFTLVAAVVLVHTLLARQSALSDADYLVAVADQVRALRPEVAVYFSGLRVLAVPAHHVAARARAARAPAGGDPAGAGQPAPARSRRHCPWSACPAPSTSMDFRMPTVRVAFYVANVGKNLHFLREPRVKHVFIGHGESDKVASVNPFTKVYDEIWVAGPDLPAALGRCGRRCAGRDGRRGGAPPAGARPASRRASPRPAADRPLRPDLGGVDRQPVRQLAAHDGSRARALAARAPHADPAALQAPPAHRHGVAGGQGGPPRDRRADRGPRRPARRGLHDAGGHLR